MHQPHASSLEIYAKITQSRDEGGQLDRGRGGVDFYEVLEQVVVLLQRHGRVSYRALKRQFDVDDGFIEDLKDELLHSRHPITEGDNHSLIWTDATGGTPVTTSQSDQVEPQPVVDHAQSIQETSSPVEPHAPEAERRQLTVMFCDLVGSTSLSSALDPEDLRDIVRAYQGTCTEVIQQYDGYVAQLLGDGLLVYFGYPVAHEDDAQRAIHTGLGILKAIETLNNGLKQKRHIELSVRLGIHTGLVVIGEMGGDGRQEQLALGETPNLAARIQHIAQPDTVVISSATHRLIQGYFDCEPLGEHNLKGVAQPLILHRVLQTSVAQSRLEVASSRGLTPLVGREREVDLLLELWQQAKAGHGQVVLLSGEAGIGKSRLVQVLKDQVSEEPHTRLECRSSPYFAHSALYPIIDMVQRVLRFQANDTPEQRLEKLEQNLCQYRLPLEETVPLFGGLLSLPVPADRYPPLRISPQLQRQKTLGSIVAITLELAERQPLLFILEDGHWCDHSTLELLDLLLDQVPTASLLVLITHRPEFTPKWGTRSYLTQLTLSRLSRDDVEQMVECITAGRSLPLEVLEQIIERCDGVALFVEEMMKSIIESENLEEVDGQYEFTGSLGSLSIPATLQDSLMARLDRLVTAKGVAQYASVMGRQFSFELLQAFSELDETMLEHELGRLVEAEVVYQRGLAPHAIYTFKHALIQDTAYQSLLRSTRQHYHQRIATVLASQFADIAERQPELLAHHYTEGGLNEQAVGYWQRAGKDASQRSASAEAMSHYEKGLDVLMRLPDTPARAKQELTLQLELRLPLQNVKGYGSPELERALKRTLSLCHLVGETAQHIEVLISLSNFYFTRQDLRTAHQMAEQALHLAQRLGDPWFLPRTHWAMGYTLNALGQLPTSWLHFEKGISLYNPHQHHPGVRRTPHDIKVFMSCYGAFVLWALGYPDQARDRNQEGLTLAQNLSHSPSLAAAYVWTAWFYRLLRQAHLVLEPAEAAIALATEYGLPFWEDQGRLYRGWALAAQGQWEAGAGQIRQGLGSLRATGAGMSPLPVVMLAEAHGMAGQAEEGLRVLSEVLPRIGDDEDQREGAARYHLKGELLLSQSSDNAAEAESCFRQAIAIAQNQSAKSWELRTATSLARLWQSQGKRDEARELLAPVYSWFTEGFDTADLIEAKAFLVELEEGR